VKFRVCLSDSFLHSMQEFRQENMNGLWTILTFVSLLASLSKTDAAIYCSQCDTKDIGRTCITSPPTPSRCKRDEKSCITVATYRQDDSKLSSLVRTCNPMPFTESMCFEGRHRGTFDRMILCYWICFDNGCNAESEASSTSFHVLDLLR